MIQRISTRAMPGWNELSKESDGEVEEQCSEAKPKQLDYAPLPCYQWNNRNPALYKSPNLSAIQDQLASMRASAIGRPGLLSGVPRSLHVFLIFIWRPCSLPFSPHWSCQDFPKIEEFWYFCTRVIEDHPLEKCIRMK